MSTSLVVVGREVYGYLSVGIIVHKVDVVLWGLCVA